MYKHLKHFSSKFVAEIYIPYFIMYNKDDENVPQN
jgi:hypothetical protein